MKRALCVVVLAACAKSGTGTATAKMVTINASVSNILVPGSTSADLATSFTDCAPQLRVRVFDAVSLLLNPATAEPLGSCNVTATGTFSCTNIDISKDYAAMYAVVDNQPGAPACATPTVGVLLGCGYADLTTASNTSCGGGKALTDNVIDASDNVLIPLYVVPKAAVTAFDSQLASTTPAVSATVTSSFASLETTGWVLLQVINGTAAAANAKPYLPATCGTTSATSHVATDCRAYTLAATNSFGLSASKVTDSSGLWIAQVQATLNGGAPQQPAFDISGNTDTPASYGAIDCSGAAQVACFESIPQGTFIAGPLFNEAPVSIVEIPSDTPATASSAAACPFQTHVSGSAAAGALACP